MFGGPMKSFLSQQSFRALALVFALVLSVFSLGVQAQNDNVSVSINTLIDQGGSSMNYELTVENRGTVNESFDMWIVVTGPNGYNDLVMNRHFNFRPGRIIIRTRPYMIQGADLGIFTFTINAGTFATGTLIDTDFDTYTRTSVSANEVQINKDIDLTGVPDKMMLVANYPNPFNPSTTISYGLNEDANVSIMIYNALGQEVTTLVNAQQTKGFHSVVWNGRDNSGNQVTSGIYFYRMITGNFVEVKKMLLNK